MYDMNKTRVVIVKDSRRDEEGPWWVPADSIGAVDCLLDAIQIGESGTKLEFELLDVPLKQYEEDLFFVKKIITGEISREEVESWSNRDDRDHEREIVEDSMYEELLKTIEEEDKETLIRLQEKYNLSFLMSIEE
jgi:hypothetical protein